MSPLETVEPLRFCGETGRQRLDRDLAVELRVDRFPDDADAAFTDLVDQAVVVQRLAGF